MKTLFIPSKLKSEVNKSEISKISRKLPKKIAVAYSKGITIIEALPEYKRQFQKMYEAIKK